MKKLIFVFVFMFISCSIVNAASLQWDAPISGNVEGYIVYYSSPDGDFNKNVGNVVQVDNIKNEFNLHPGTLYSFYVTAYNISGESGKSNTINFTSPVFVPIEDILPSTTIIIPGTVTIIIN